MNMDGRACRAGTNEVWADMDRKIGNPGALHIGLINKSEHAYDAGQIDNGHVYALAAIACRELHTRRIEAAELEALIAMM